MVVLAVVLGAIEVMQWRVDRIDLPLVLLEALGG